MRPKTIFICTILEHQGWVKEAVDEHTMDGYILLLPTCTLYARTCIIEGLTCQERQYLNDATMTVYHSILKLCDELLVLHDTSPRPSFMVKTIDLARQRHMPLRILTQADWKATIGE